MLSLNPLHITDLDRTLHGTFEAGVKAIQNGTHSGFFYPIALLLVKRK